MVVLIGASALAGGACSSGFAKPPNSGLHLTIELKDQDKVAGTRLHPLPLAIGAPQPFRIVVRAIDKNGNVDASFNRSVRISAKPGAIESIVSPDADGRSLRLTNGESPETEIKLTNAYGTTYILADDLGYESIDPTTQPPPACANGVDDDRDGKTDFPTDEGCAFANDDSEYGGSYAQGTSPPIFYHLPRIADVRGLRCNPDGTCGGTGATPYRKEAILLDTGFHDREDGSQGFDFDMVVTRIASDGFYLSDIKDTRGGFNNVFSFNFNAPPLMRVCDRIKTFGGTADEFFGFTQLSYPTWTLEEWDPQKRPCLVPEPRVLGFGDDNSDTLMPLSGGLVRVVSLSEGGQPRIEVKVTPKFGPGLMPCKDKSGQVVKTEDCTPPPQGVTANTVFVPSADAGTDCDINRDGEIDFSKGSLEGACAAACTADRECTEYSNYASRSTFRLTVKDVTNGNAAAFQADATTSAEFKPLDMKGIPIRSFSGTLHFFSGGNQFTIEARCKDDIVVDVDAQPLPSDRACVTARTDLEQNPQ
jgi:hypothetical protein